MTRDEKIAEARRLNGEGLSNPKIAALLGVTKSAVWKWLHPERTREWEHRQNARRGPAKRAWEEAHRARCSSCGGPMALGSVLADGSRSSKAPKGDICAGCETARRVDNALEMWRLRCDENLNNKVIADRMGLPHQTVTSELYRLRALGFAVPASPYLSAASRTGRHALVVAPGTESLGRALAARGITPDRERVAA